MNIINIYFALFFLSCHSMQGHRSISSNLRESKKNGLFVAEYFARDVPYVINDSIKLQIKEAWLEKQWGYGKSSDEIIVISGFQLVIITTKTDLQNYDDSWKIGISKDRYIRPCGKDCLISDFTSIPKNIEEWDVQNGYKLDSASKKEIIGKFVIYKKP